MVSRSDLSTLTLAFGSVRLKHVPPFLLAEGEGERDEFEGVFVVKPPKIEAEVGEVGDGRGESEEVGGRWLAKAFRSEWLEGKLREEEEGKGR